MSKEVERNPGPKWTEGVPFCAEENCPEYDGKRCRMMGFRPSQICEPAVRQMSADLAAVTKRVDAAEAAAEGKRDCSLCVWEGIDCNDKQPEGCKRWLCVPPGFVPQFKLDEALASVKQIGEECDEFRRLVESCATERPWTGCLLMHITEDEHAPAGVVVDFETSDGPSELWLPLADIPEDCRELGAKCRIEWSQERWTQVELDEARKRAEGWAPRCEPCDVE